MNNLPTNEGVERIFKKAAIKAAIVIFSFLYRLYRKP
jgi:hypothetical protein